METLAAGLKNRKRIALPIHQRGMENKLKLVKQLLYTMKVH
jgi:hypothetical protein